MKEPVWLPHEVVLATHEALLNRFGGLAGVRDAGFLESALLRPQDLWSYGGNDLFAMAASYAAGIVKNHPFLDGNKRIGFMTAYIFLGANQLSVEATEEEVVERTVALAASAISEAYYAAWLERVCIPA